MSSLRSVKRLAIVAALVAVAGYLAGLLTAPKSGRQIREGLRSAALTGISEAEKQLKQLHSELGELLTESKKRGESLKGDAAEELNTLAAQAQIAKDKAREVLSAIHEGDASDEDLKQAVKQASEALDHLRVYLKK